MGINLNPLTDVASLGNAIGGVFGNNTSQTSVPNILSSQPSLNFLASDGNTPIVQGSSNGIPAGVTHVTPLQTAQTPGTQQQLGGTSQIIYGVNDPGTLAAYTQGIQGVNQQLGALDTTNQVQGQNIQNAYNQAFNQLLQGNTDATAQYNQAKTGDAQNYLTAKNTIGTQAGQSLNGLERLLGSRGAGGSSAYLFAAPQAVASQASQQRGQAGQTFGQNEQGLDTNFNNYTTGYNQSQQGLKDQLTNNQNNLAQSIASSRANLQSSLAQLIGQQSAATGGNPATSAQPYLDAANNYQQQAAGLGTQQYSFNPNTPTYQAPSVDSYTNTPFSTAQVANAPNAVGSAVSPYLQALLKPKTSASGLTT